MDPLSILGAISAATALAQQTIQLAQFLVNLYGNIKDAPERIQTRLSSIERLTEIANLVRTTAPLQTTQVATALKATTVSAKKLLEILEKLNLEDRGKLKKVFVQWKAALKENDILLLLDRIERSKNELALCFLQIEASQLHSTNIRITQVRDTLGDVSLVIDNLGQTITTKLEHLPAISGKFDSIYAELPARFDSLESQLKGLTLVPVPVQVSAIYEVPTQTVRSFIGREDILNLIKKAASTKSEAMPQVMVLRGMGGQGKTQVALKFCSHMKGARDVFWINASNEAGVRSRFASFATLLQPTAAAEMGDQDQAAFAIRILASWSKPWLIVFDEYDDPATFSNLDEYIPEHEYGLVLITTRHAAVDQLADPDYRIQLPSLPEDEAVDLLMREAQSKAVVRQTGRQTAKDIAARLGCHALAIAQAGSYIRSNRQTLEKFIDTFEQEKSNILENWRHQMSRYRKKVGTTAAETSIGVFATWELSYQQLEREDTTSGHLSDLLTLIAFFDSNGVSEELLQTFCMSKNDLSWSDLISSNDGLAKSNIENTPRSSKDPDDQQEPAIDHGLETDEEKPRRLMDRNISYSGVLLERYAKEAEIWATLEELSLIQDFELREDGFYHTSFHPLIRDWIRIRTDKIAGHCRKYSSLAATATLLRLADIGEDNTRDMYLLPRLQVLAHVQAMLNNQELWFENEGIFPDDKTQAGYPEYLIGCLFDANGDLDAAEYWINEAYKQRQHNGPGNAPLFSSRREIQKQLKIFCCL